MPATDQAAGSSWLTANGNRVSAQYDIDGLRVSIGHLTKAFSATIDVLVPTAG